MLSFYKQQSYFSQIVSKKSQNNNIIFYEKQQKIWNLVSVLCIWFQLIQWVDHRLKTCNLESGQSISYKYLDQFWF